MFRFLYQLRRTLPAIVAGVIALTTSNLAAPANAQAVPRDLQSYSASEISALPDGTQIKIAGSVFSLGALRAEHAHRLARFAAAAALGSRIASDVHGKSTMLLSQSSMGSTVPNVTPKTGAASPPAPDPYHAVPPVPNMHAGNLPLPADAAEMCAATAATACLYLPSNTTFVNLPGVSNGVLVEIDPIIGQSDCAQEGGVMMQIAGCTFNYPTAFVANFLPGNPAIGLPKFVVDCPGMKVDTDPKGAIVMSLSVSGLTTFTNATAACVAVAYVVN
jgi:hypothetical protein